MTEDEAKTKWCPQAANTKALISLSATVPAMASNQATVAAVLEKVASEIGDAEKCIASGCMMWVEDTSVNSSSGARRICGGHCGLVK